MSEELTDEKLKKRLQKDKVIAKAFMKLKKSEEALKISREKYRCLVESLESDYIIYSHDVDGNFSYISPSIVNVLGYNQDEFKGHYSKYMTDSSINKDVSKYTNAALRGEKQKPYEAEFYHKNGSLVYLLVTEVPMFDDTGNVLGIEGIVQDITEIKRLAAERERIIKKLEKALSEIKTLRGILPICSFCKKIRDDKGYWEQVDVYINKHSEVDFSHSICPECMKEHYLDIYEKLNRRKPNKSPL